MALSWLCASALSCRFYEKSLSTYYRSAFSREKIEKSHRINNNLSSVGIMLQLATCNLVIITSMSSDTNPFIPSLGKLALSLGVSPDSPATASDSTQQLSQRRQICIVTLLRIIDNILDDPDQLNPKLRKIKVSNPAFHKRCGQWDGSIDFLLQCEFKMKGSTTSKNLRLDVEDHDMLLFGREMLVQFAVLTLGV